MVYYILILGIPVAFFVGFYLREVLNIVKKIEVRLGSLKLAQDKANTPMAGASFAEPMTRVEIAAEMERERIEALNR